MAFVYKRTQVNVVSSQDSRNSCKAVLWCQRQAYSYQDSSLSRSTRNVNIYDIVVDILLRYFLILKQVLGRAQLSDLVLFVAIVVKKKY